jgi:3-oxoadipate enol-lactonase
MTTLGVDVDGPAGAPVLVLGASLGATASMWTPHLPALTRHVRVLRYDHLGHGRSAVPPGPYTMELLGTAVLDALDAHGVGRVCYAGTSLGGMVGIWLAAHAPERIGSLVLACTSAYLPPALNWTSRAAVARADGPGALADTVVSRWFTPGWAAAHPDVVARFRDGIAATPAEGYAGCAEAIAAMDLRAALPGIAAPTLVVGAEDDPAIPVEHSAAIAAVVPDARFEVIAGAHQAAFERADEFTELVLDHIGRSLAMK